MLDREPWKAVAIRDRRIVPFESQRVDKFEIHAGNKTLAVVYRREHAEQIARMANAQIAADMVPVERRKLDLMHLVLTTLEYSRATQILAQYDACVPHEDHDAQEECTRCAFDRAARSVWLTREVSMLLANASRIERLMQARPRIQSRDRVTAIDAAEDGK